MMWEKICKDGLEFYTLPAWQAAGAAVHFSCRTGGVSAPPYDSLDLGLHVGDDEAAVLENRRRCARALAAEDFVTTQQTHSRHIRRVDKRDAGRGFAAYADAFADTDGLVSDEPGLLLATFYADCLPLACFDAQHRAVGMAHAGFRGTAQNIAAAMVERMAAEFGSRADELLVAIGAGIHRCCYEVGEDFRAQFPAEATDWFRDDGNGKYHFDNVRANRDQLTAAGVAAEHIAVLDRCTCCAQDEFFSYRGSGGTTGRQGLFVQLI